MARIELEIPDDVTVEVDRLDVTVDGPEGSVTRRLWYPDVSVSVDDDQVVIESDTENRKTTATMGTFESHLSNMFHGVSDGWEYRMEVHYSHFPMQVTVEGDEVVIENFLGERAPRRTPVRGDTDVQVDGEELTLSGPSKEDVGQTAADIEQLTRVTDKDTRVFQDGVYIVEKPTGGA
ncbi:50S ribosomal protein L6 [Salarchaeum sp. JOR-1]|uniref:50S ribosomal protein L6 n=1 Tax=Salarchaeum sp. JOR-1 TaxID=2599399 RepID=UPI0011989FA5|nr:50S ribosomal protein L6 [Salarchaeum sp. JOR-1]QDX40771.1 50S ribosomal protein L6 [Salarchaeum sp. JOR-1]